MIIPEARLDPTLVGYVDHFTGDVQIGTIDDPKKMAQATQERTGFRYVPDLGLLMWWGTPTKEDVWEVESWLQTHGYQVKLRARYSDKIKIKEVIKTLRGTPIRRFQNNVGKQVGPQLYVHRKYAAEVIPHEKLRFAVEALKRIKPHFRFNSVMWNRETGIIRFDEAPDFDTAREPHVGKYIAILPNGSAREGESNNIWHHKWQWVKDDYKGFDVDKSKEWSTLWASRLGQVAKGTDSSFQTQLKSVGLTENVPEKFGLGQIGPYGEVDFKWIPSVEYHGAEHSGRFEYRTNLRFRFHFSSDKHHGMVYWGAHKPDKPEMDAVEDFFRRKGIEVTQRDWQLNLLREIMTPQVILGAVKPSGEVYSEPAELLLERHPAKMRADFRWRYWPEIEKLMWWGTPDDKQSEDVKEHLLNEYGQKVLRVEYSQGSSTPTINEDGPIQLRTLIKEADKDEAALEFLKKMVQIGPFRGDVYLAGGAVRDMVMGKTPKDLDIVVTNHGRRGGFDFAVWLTKQMGNFKGPAGPPPRPPSGVQVDDSGYPESADLDAANPPTDIENSPGAQKLARYLEAYTAYYASFSNPVIYPKFGTAKVELTGTHNGVDLTGMKVEAVFARKEVYTPGSRKPKVYPGTIHDDAFRRDFTVNSMMMDLTKGDILDLTGKGRDDIKAGIIRSSSPPDEIFGQDALRMFRAVRFATKYDWQIEPQTWIGIQRNLDQLVMNNTSRERVRDEINKMLETHNPRRAFELMKDLGLLPFVAPEFQQAVGMTQNVHHTQDVFDHTMTVLQSTQPELVRRLIALFHDIGKVATRSETPTGVHFYSHEEEGTKIAEKIMRDLKYPTELIDAVKAGVGNHMRLKHGGDDAVKLSDKALRKFKIDLGQHLEHILDVIHADNIAHADASAMPNQIENVRRRLEQLNIQVKEPELPIDGNEIMALGVPKGEGVGVIKELLANKWLEDGKLDLDTAMVIVRQAIPQLPELIQQRRAARAVSRK